ncbi:MAG: hypothetical protein WAL91_05790 [Propionicimonas sp.]
MVIVVGVFDGDLSAGDGGREVARRTPRTRPRMWRPIGETVRHEEVQLVAHCVGVPTQLGSER